MYGSISENSQKVAGLMYDFTRCVRADGSVYGSRGKCRKGRETGAKEEQAKPKATKKPRLNKNEKIALEVMSDKSIRSDKKRVAKMISLGVPKDTDFVALVSKTKEKVGLKSTQTIRDSTLSKPKQSVADRMAAAYDKLEEKLPKVPKETEEKRKLREAVSKGAKLRETATEEELNGPFSAYRTLRKFIKDPALNTIENRARLINLRLAIWQRQKAEREKTSPRNPKEYQQALKSSPKYKETPGSREPMKAETPSAEKLEKEMKALSKAFDKAKTPEEKLKVSERLLEVGARLKEVEDGRTPKSPKLSDIYERQGFNAKPELVGTISDLRGRRDIMTREDGSPMILYRGVSTTEFADQFKGVGENGSVHYPGKGIHGNGTYAATASSSSNSEGSSMTAIRTAKGYAGDQENLNQKVTAFAIRKDANVVTFEGTKSERYQAYDKWFDEVIEEAEKKTGFKFKDVGEAAAALGIHAYQVPQSEEDFFVILNRGAVVAAMDSGIPDK